MAFCKICACGEKVVFQRRLSFPDTCPACGRRLMDFRTYPEDDPQVEELLKKNSPDEPEISLETSAEISSEIITDISEVQKQEFKEQNYVLRLSNGAVIPIPPGGCIIGRTETGAEELAEFPSVSRQHLRVTPKKNIGMIIEDLSTYGTWVDGKKIEKNVPVGVTSGVKIVLCNLETVLVGKEEK